MENKDNIFEYVKENGRVCPKPQKWNELWDLLPNKKRVGAGWLPPLPLILSAWWETTDEEKRNRLEVHLKYAQQNGLFEEVSNFLHRLTTDDWAFEGDV